VLWTICIGGAKRVSEPDNGRTVGHCPEGIGRTLGTVPHHSAIGIANEFLRLRADPSWPSQLFVQKLVYIAHGWNLAINNEPLVDEAPQAWDNGPVFRSIWNHIKTDWFTGENCTLVDPKTKQEISAPITEAEREIIHHVWRKYGSLSANELSKMTHQPGTPWFKAYFEHGRNSSLDNTSIKQHYIDLALAGRGAA
jgi:uncharacterized phage-associated protein